MKFLKKKWVLFIIVPAILLFLLFILRYPILRGIGNYLVSEDPLEKVEAIFVLSGSAYARGTEAAEIYKMGYAKKIILTGQELSVPAVEAFCLDSISTSELTQKFVIVDGVKPEDTELLVKGTSTFEEFEAIREYCKTNHMKHIMVVSSNYHTRRIRNVFKNALAKDGIDVVIRGAKRDGFHPESWWTNEGGLIAVNNEYVKLVYYAFKY